MKSLLRCPVDTLLLLLVVQGGLGAVLQPREAVQNAVDVDPLDVVPKELLLGAGLSAGQAEGATDEGGKGQSALDWVVARLPNEYPASNNVSADHYHRFKEDLGLAKQMNLTSHRFSISWARIFPEGDTSNPNHVGIQFYHDYIEEVINNGMEPLVTMYHFDHPMNLQHKVGGWTYPGMVDYFVEFAEFLFKEYGDKIKYWNPINEGNMYCIFILPKLAQAGSTALDDTSYYKCLHHTILAHARTYKMYNEKYRSKQKGFVGTSTLIWPASPADPNAPEDIEAARIFNEVFGATPVHPIVYGGEYPAYTRYLTEKRSKEQGLKESKLPHFTREEREKYFSDGPVSDFVGLNVYAGYKVTLARNASDVGKKPPVLLPILEDMDMPHVKVVSGGGFEESDANLLRTSLVWTWESFHLPLVITENGFADTKGAGVQDSGRAEYLRTVLRVLVRTMNEFQIPVISYHMWSLLDVFEFTGGFDKRPFGLIHVDYEGNTLNRTIKESSKVFIEIAKTGRVPSSTSAGATSTSALALLSAAVLTALLT